MAILIQRKKSSKSNLIFNSKKKSKTRKYLKRFRKHSKYLKVKNVKQYGGNKSKEILIQNQHNGTDYDTLFFHAGRTKEENMLLSPYELMKEHKIFPFGESVGELFAIVEDEIIHPKIIKFMCSKLFLDKVFTSMNFIHTITVNNFEKDFENIKEILKRYGDASWHQSIKTIEELTKKIVDVETKYKTYTNNCNNNETLIELIDIFKNCTKLAEVDSVGKGFFLVPRKIIKPHEFDLSIVEPDKLLQYLNENYKDKKYEIYIKKNIKSDIQNEILITAGVIKSIANNENIESETKRLLENKKKVLETDFKIQGSTINICEDEILRIYIH